MKARDELVQLFKGRALKKGSPHKLASGLVSNIYVNSKEITLHGPSLLVLSKILVAALAEQSDVPTLVAGVSIGGDPIVAGVILEAARQNWGLGGLLVRKEPKAHGATSGRCVEGAPPKENDRVWLLEDVVSTGASSITAAQNLLNEGYPLAGVMVLVDRQMGGLQKLRQMFEVPVIALITLAELE